MARSGSAPSLSYNTGLRFWQIKTWCVIKRSQSCGPSYGWSGSNIRCIDTNYVVQLEGTCPLECGTSRTGRCFWSSPKDNTMNTGQLVPFAHHPSSFANTRKASYPSLHMGFHVPYLETVHIFSLLFVILLQISHVFRTFTYKESHHLPKVYATSSTKAFPLLSSSADSSKKMHGQRKYRVY